MSIPNNDVNLKTYETDFFGQKLIVEIGEIAFSTDGSVLLRTGETTVLATAVMSPRAKTDLDFFPLTVHYEEKMYAVGKVPGGFIRREGRPSENAILTARLIDRPIRPLFADGMRNEVQIICQALSVEPDFEPEILAINGAALSLAISSIPLNDLIAAVHVGYVAGQLLINPNEAQRETSLLSLKIAGTKLAINMVECQAQEVDETLMLEALQFGHEAIIKLITFMETIIADNQPVKQILELAVADDSYVKIIDEQFSGEINELLKITDKATFLNNEAAFETKLIALYPDADQSSLLTSFQIYLKRVMRQNILDHDLRPYGRGLTQIRPLASRIDLLPRTHGSALFTRGGTQSLATVTLGSLYDAQKIDGLDIIETSKRFMMHYNFAPFSVNSTGRVGATSRREVGHGSLGEKALDIVIPDRSIFPYTIRVVAETMASDGSSSQAAICAATLALMHAGVPISAPVAGIAMGLVTDTVANDQQPVYKILSDIAAIEDYLGDMDFKVSGTTKGICTIQMDMKISGITSLMIKDALAAAKVGRLAILEHMAQTIAEPAQQLTKYAPKFKVITIQTRDVPLVIGRGGDIISKIVEEFNVKIDIEADDTKSGISNIFILSKDAADIELTITKINSLVKRVAVGDKYEAIIYRIEDYGIFLKIDGGQQVMVHVSKLAISEGKTITEQFKINDKLLINISTIDEKGRIEGNISLGNRNGKKE